MPYQQTTLLQAVADLAARLDDPGNVRWLVDECRRYIMEALGTYGGLTGTFRGTGVFSTASLSPFYDLPTVLPALRGYTVTDADLVTSIQYHLLEPVNPAVWQGSPQFTLNDLYQAIQRRRDQFIRETASVITVSAQGISPPTQGRIVLVNPAIMDIRRVSWTRTDRVVFPLFRDDEWAFDHYATTWRQSPEREPEAYSVAVTQPLMLQVWPLPLDTGTLGLLTLNQGAALGQANPVPLGIPNDWTWVVKWGAMADLLSQSGLATDAARAAYCQQRWQQGIQWAAVAPVVLTARVNDVVTDIAAIPDLDHYSALWQTVAGPPQVIGTMGHSLVAIAPPPGVSVVGGPWSITLDVVQNTPVPVTLDQCLPTGPGVLDAILDYAEHLALFKEGGDQLTATQPLLTRFLSACGVTMTKDQANVPNRAALMGQTVADQRNDPNTSEVVAVDL